MNKKKKIQVVQLRKQSKKTSFKVKLAIKPFENDFVKNFAITTFINGYNHNMNGVDQIKHLQTRLEILSNQCVLKDYKLLFLFLLKTSLVNIHLLSFHLLIQKRKKFINQKWS